MAKIPIFVITCNRLTVLKKSMESWKKLGDVELVIHDNNSTYPPMVEYLDELSSQGVRIYKHPLAKGTYYDISESVRETITKWFAETKSNSKYYIVSDPDIELENPSPELLDYYKELLDKSGVTVVGPMLRIDDLPEHYTLKKEMIQAQEGQFWTKPRKKFKDVETVHCGIDTTFGLYKSSFQFRRLNHGYRVFEPYMARHLDWYLDTKNLSDEEKYYKDHATSLSTNSQHIKDGGMKGYRPPLHK